MKYQKLSIVKLHELLVNKKITHLDLTIAALQAAYAELDSNAINYLANKEAKQQVKKIEQSKKSITKGQFLNGIPYFAKDNFSTKGILTTSSSNILKGYIPPFDATVIKKLTKKNAILIGKAALDELGMGGVGLYSCNGKIYNPTNTDHLIGGSSSGSAFLVAKGIVPFAIGSDTGDSIRKPASYNNIVGFKPSYGAISRYGLLPYSPSLDTVGFFTRNVADMAIVADATFGYDAKDATSYQTSATNIYKQLLQISKITIFGYFKKVINDLEPQQQTKYFNFFKQLEVKGFTVLQLDFDQELLEAISPIYMMISYSEAVSTNANLDGIKFGKRIDGENYIEVIKNSRTQGFGDEVKKRFLIGSLNLNKKNQNKYLIKAKKVRRIIVEKLTKIFNQIDVLIIPPTASIAPLIDELNQKQKNEDDKNYLEYILILANFNGSPSITIPFMKKQGLGIGINLMTKPKSDLLCLQAAKLFEDIIGIKNEIVEK